MEQHDEIESQIMHASSEVERILDIARQNKTVLRLVGGLAIHEFCTDHSFCDRHYGDIDFVGLSSQYENIVQVMKDAGYLENVNMTMSTGGSRLLFNKAEQEEHIDVFLDRLDIEHVIELKDRLEIEMDTVSVSDLLLIKLTITRLNEKDIRDIITIVKDLQMGHTDSPNTINMTYIADLCGKSWGLYHDVLRALRRTLNFLPEYPLPKKTRVGVMKKLESLEELILESPKSLKWRLRAPLGEHIPWHREIETDRVACAPANDEMQVNVSD